MSNPTQKRRASRRRVLRLAGVLRLPSPVLLEILDHRDFIDRRLDLHAQEILAAEMTAIAG